MTTPRFAFRAHVIGIAWMLVPGLPLAAAGASGEQTPGSEQPAEAAARGGSPPTDVCVPESTKAAPGDAGVRAHTNILIRNPSGVTPKGMSDLAQPEPPTNPIPKNAPEKCHRKTGP